MPTPASRILARSQALGLGGVKDGFDPAAQARGGFRRLGPHGSQHLEHSLCVDLANRLAPQGCGMDRERVAPLPDTRNAGQPIDGRREIGGGSLALHHDQDDGDGGLVSHIGGIATAMLEGSRQINSRVQDRTRVSLTG